MTTAINTQSLSRNFGRTAALSDISLEIPRGAVYALVGANGAGKTTLIKVLMNIFQPTSGTARILGIDSRRLAGKAFNRIGYVSENQQMPDWMTVGEMLSYYRNFYPQWDRSLEDALVRQFELPLDRKLKYLSRGMRMKAAFASSLAYRPDLIVLDEPFSGLDPLVRDELIEGLIDRAQETTIFLSSHDLAEIEGFSSHIGFLDRGHLLFSEEMSNLASRFREVTITVANPPDPLPTPPASWLLLESVDSVIRFVHCRYNGPATSAEVEDLFPQARDIRFEAMSLRSIFLAIAKSGRVHDAAGPAVPAETTEVRA